MIRPLDLLTCHNRMFTGSLQEEVKFLEEEIEAVKERVDDDVISEKIRQFIYAPKEIQNTTFRRVLYKACSQLSNCY